MISGCQRYIVEVQDTVWGLSSGILRILRYVSSINFFLILWKFQNIIIMKLNNENLKQGGAIVTASPSFLNPRGYIWMTLQTLLDVPMSLSDIHFFMPSDFDKFATVRNLKINMTSIDHDWGGGDRTILDFKKRLVNALKDKGFNNKNVPEFLEWFKESIGYFNHDDNSGAITVTSIYK